jgi:hypothetical protein
MLPKIVFDKTALVKLKLVTPLNKTLIKPIQNNQNLYENPYQPIGFKISRLLPNLCDFQ